MLDSKAQAFALLDTLGAPEHLKTHVTLVGEAAEILIAQLHSMSLPFDAEFVRVGVALHDVGKIQHPNEMTGPGSEHEPAGEKLLLELGVEARTARVCLSHARFEQMECSIEELFIALSDKLWKGKRVESLELRAIDAVAEALALERWDIFAELDACFERIADDGQYRLERSCQ